MSEPLLELSHVSHSFQPASLVELPNRANGEVPVSACEQ